jgi:hypothetical protein
MKVYCGSEFSTSALDGGNWSTSRYQLGENPTAPIGLGAGWAPKPVWTQWRRKISQPLQGIEARPSDRSLSYHPYSHYKSFTEMRR